MITGLEAAKIAGLRPGKFAVAAGVTRATIYNWTKIPPEKVPLIADLTGLPRWKIRPDLWGRRKK